MLTNDWETYTITLQTIDDETLAALLDTDPAAGLFTQQPDPDQGGLLLEPGQRIEGTVRVNLDEPRLSKPYPSVYNVLRCTQ